MPALSSPYARYWLLSFGFHFWNVKNVIRVVKVPNDIDALWLWSTKSHTSIPFVFEMKITPGLVGENTPHVLYAPKVYDDVKIGLW